MALSKLQNFIAKTAKSSNKIISGLALALLLSLATQDAKAQTGGVGIGEPNPAASLHIGNNANKA
jgi:hypothetical protein